MSGSRAKSSGVKYTVVESSLVEWSQVYRSPVESLSVHQKSFCLSIIHNAVGTKLIMHFNELTSFKITQSLRKWNSH